MTGLALLHRANVPFKRDWQEHMANARKYIVGLVQMRMGAIRRRTSRRRSSAFAEAARLGANIVCLPELFRAQYFCQREDLGSSTLPSRFPGRPRRSWRRLRATTRRDHCIAL